MPAPPVWVRVQCVVNEARLHSAHCRALIRSKCARYYSHKHRSRIELHRCAGAGNRVVLLGNLVADRIKAAGRDVAAGRIDHLLGAIGLHGAKTKNAAAAGLGQGERITCKTRFDRADDRALACLDHRWRRWRDVRSCIKLHGYAGNGDRIVVLVGHLVANGIQATRGDAAAGGVDDLLDAISLHRTETDNPVAASLGKSEGVTSKTRLDRADDRALAYFDHRWRRRRDVRSCIKLHGCAGNGDRIVVLVGHLVANGIHATRGDAAAGGVDDLLGAISLHSAETDNPVAASLGKSEGVTCKTRRDGADDRALACLDHGLRRWRDVRSCIKLHGYAGNGDRIVVLVGHLVANGIQATRGDAAAGGIDDLLDAISLHGAETENAAAAGLGKSEGVTSKTRLDRADDRALAYFDHRWRRRRDVRSCIKLHGCAGNGDRIVVLVGHLVADRIEAAGSNAALRGVDHLLGAIGLHRTETDNPVAASLGKSEGVTSKTRLDRADDRALAYFDHRWRRRRDVRSCIKLNIGRAGRHHIGLLFEKS